MAAAVTAMATVKVVEERATADHGKPQGRVGKAAAAVAMLEELAGTLEPAHE